MAFKSSLILKLCVILAILNEGNLKTATPTPNRNSKCECGWRQQRRIVGGVETGVNEYAFMASVIHINYRTVWCGAAIIAHFYALSAAHCFTQKTSDELGFGLLVGDHNIYEAHDTKHAKLYRISSYKIHPQFNSTDIINDIAVVRTEKSIEFSPFVGPICLPYRYTTVDFEGAPVMALGLYIENMFPVGYYIYKSSGFGSKFFNGPKSDTLQVVNLTVVGRKYCQTFYHEPIVTSQICTYAAHKDACTFDSGGPIIWFDTFNTNRFQLLGLVSHGDACAIDAPGVNTNVASFLKWILKVSADASYCWL